MNWQPIMNNVYVTAEIINIKILFLFADQMKFHLLKKKNSNNNTKKKKKKKKKNYCNKVCFVFRIERAG